MTVITEAEQGTKESAVDVVKSTSTDTPSRLPPSSSTEIRPMSWEDVSACASIEAACYPDPVCEGLDFFHRFWKQRGSTCWVAISVSGGVVGYAFSLPTRLALCPLELGGNHQEASSNKTNDTMYLHDIAVAPAARRKGIGAQLFQTVRDSAATSGLPTMTLTAVCGAWEYWQSRHGFEDLQEVSHSARQRLQSYPKECGAVRMMQRRTFFPACVPVVEEK